MRQAEAPVKQAEPDRPLSHEPKKLRYRRIAAGFTVTDLAAKSGYSKAHLSMLEDGQHGASAECLKAIAGVLGCEIADLMPASDAA